MIKDCNNDECNHEILILNKQANIFEHIPANRNQYMDSLPSELIDDKYKNQMYFFDPKSDKSYCTDCVKSIKKCCDSGGSMIYLIK